MGQSQSEVASRPESRRVRKVVMRPLNGERGSSEKSIETDYIKVPFTPNVARVYKQCGVIDGKVKCMKKAHSMGRCVYHLDSSILEDRSKNALENSNVSLGDCAICLDNITSDGYTSPCFHHFHLGCIRKMTKSTCPCCRKELHNLPEEVVESITANNKKMRDETVIEETEDLIRSMGRSLQQTDQVVSMFSDIDITPYIERVTPIIEEIMPSSSTSQNSLREPLGRRIQNHNPVVESRNAPDFFSSFIAGSPLDFRSQNQNGNDLLRSLVNAVGPLAMEYARGAMMRDSYNYDSDEDED